MGSSLYGTIRDSRITPEEQDARAARREAMTQVEAFRQMSPEEREAITPTSVGDWLSNITGQMNLPATGAGSVLGFAADRALGGRGGIGGVLGGIAGGFGYPYLTDRFNRDQETGTA